MERLCHGTISKRGHGTVRYWDCDGTERSRHGTISKRGHETAVRWRPGLRGCEVADMPGFGGLRVWNNGRMVSQG